MIYGRVMVDPVQNLGDSFSCSIEKVFLCTGADGYVPKYNPTNKEYGCLADAPSLLYRFKILVRCNGSSRKRKKKTFESSVEERKLRSYLVSVCVCVCVLYRTRPSRRLKLKHLVMFILRPHWLKTHPELFLWSGNRDRMASHSPRLRFSRSVWFLKYSIFM